MPTLWISIIFITHSLLVFGGFGDKPPVKWGKVDPSEFEVRPPAGSEGSHAIVLCDYGTIEVTNRSFYSRHTRIRILDEEGMAYGTIEIPYQTVDNHDDFVKLQAQMVLLRDGKPVVLKVPRKQIKDVIVDDYWSKKVIVFTDLEPGAIIEYRYKLASLDFAKLDDWYFQREIPTLWSEVRFEVPRPFVYLVTFQNNRRLSFSEMRIYRESLRWLYDTRRITRDVVLAARDHLLFQTNESRYKVWIMNNYKKKIVMKNLPGLADNEGNRVSPDLYPQLRMHLFESYGNLPPKFRSLLITTADDYPFKSWFELMNDMTAVSGYVHYRLKTWPEMNDDLLEHERFGRMLMQSADREGLPENLFSESMPERDRITAIYDYVRQNFQWNGNYSMYTTLDMSRLLENKTGASADLNLLLINLLRRSGLEAEPVLIRTSDLGRPEWMYPVHNQFNHVIALIYVNGERILLDTTSGQADYPLLNVKSTDTRGWVVSSNRPGWVYIFPRNDTPAFEEPEAPQFSL